MKKKLHPSWCLYAGLCGAIFSAALSILTNALIFNPFIWVLPGIMIFAITLYKANYFSLLLAVIVGAIIMNCRCSFEISSKEHFMNLAGEAVILSGKVSDDPITQDNNTTLRLRSLRLCQRNESDIELECGEELAGLAYVQLVRPPTELERSDLVQLEGKLSAGFGIFVTTLYRPNLIGVERSTSGDIFARLKNWFAQIVHNLLPSPEADLGLGYLMGQKSGLSDELTEALRIVGMSHVVVASGAHLGILINMSKRIFGKISKFASLIFSLIFIAIFVLIVGFTPSMTRAALVTAISLAVGYFGRKFTPLRLLILVGAITLFIDPNNVINLGWQLSFASFAGIMIIAPKLQKTFYGGKKPPWLASMLITSLATCIMCGPILIYSFGSISLLSFVANLIILPTLPYAMLLVFLTGATSFCSLLAGLVARLTTLLLDLHLLVIDFLSKKTMFVLELPSGNLGIFWMYLLIVILFAFPSLYRRRRTHLNKHRQNRRNIV